MLQPIIAQLVTENRQTTQHADKEGLGRAHPLHGAALRVAPYPAPTLLEAVPARPARLPSPAPKSGAVAARFEGEKPVGVAAGLQPP